jgi:hypothetical protein
VNQHNSSQTSDSQGGGYFLSISLPLIIICTIPTIRAATCLLTGSWNSCNFPPRDEYVGLEMPAIFSIFLVLPALPFLWACYAPLFLLAKGLAKRHPMRRNSNRVLYWIFSWAVIGLSPWVLVFAVDVSSRGFAQTKRLLLSDPFLILVFVAYGALCGVFYCMFTLRRRS